MPEGVGDGDEGESLVFGGRDGVKTVIFKKLSDGGSGDGGGTFGETCNTGQSHGLLRINNKFADGSGLIDFFEGINDGTAAEGDTTGVVGNLGIAEDGINGHIKIKFNDITGAPLAGDDRGIVHFSATLDLIRTAPAGDTETEGEDCI